MFKDGRLKKLPSVSDSHHLVQIATATGISAFLSPEQLQVLDKLTLMTEIGRYPTPAKSDRYYHELATGPHPSQQMRSVWMAADDVRVRQAIEAIYAAMNQPTPAELSALTDRV